MYTRDPFKAHRFTKIQGWNVPCLKRNYKGEGGNKGKMIQGKAEGTEVRGAFGSTFRTLYREGL